MMKKFRAYYKPDFDTPDGALKFQQKIIKDDIFFVYGEDVWYPFQIPFLDDDWILDQWVGKLDSKGVEIYENDIVSGKRMDINLICKWHEDACCWCFRIRNDQTSYHLYYAEDSFEVIGNIHETPELIN
jgi:uncharacterized phage protein (TIGR01671 family)